MKKFISIILIAIVFLFVITACKTTEIQEEPTADVSEGIEEVTEVDEELNQEEVDSDLNNLEDDLSNW